MEKIERSIFYRRFFHWTLVFLVLMDFATAWLQPIFQKNTTISLFDIHMSYGVLLLPVLLGLFITRLYRIREKTHEETTSSIWTKRVATAMHYTLYILLILVSLSGWALVSEYGKTITLFNSFDLPLFLAGNAKLQATLAGMHSFLAYTVGILILGHLAAALYHHFISKNSLLLDMLPDFLKSKNEQR